MSKLGENVFYKVSVRDVLDGPYRPAIITKVDDKDPKVVDLCVFTHMAGQPVKVIYNVHYGFEPGNWCWRNDCR